MVFMQDGGVLGHAFIHHPHVYLFSSRSRCSKQKERSQDKHFVNLDVTIQNDAH